ncbi:leucine-rich repeat, immunoglobulin-like domain and transmembrane domain-containing protein 3 isoform X2 [Apus apus]|uniref:leucine-rich repeat, immunoglobulin-like domain and transmembrane domain-containing protein 3 isoform X2 n=1 Tax=Apus apus TaxID=8895 RepID=UPI0021F82617|nr:leucine-rich repeat, immunoglobulin-like domain and transmembrane domain-containing protein 3 isoform X2 [Apus apus]
MAVYIHICSTLHECLGIKFSIFFSYQFCWEEVMYLFICFYLLMSFFEEVHGFCPSQCTCVYHGRSDGTGTRSVLCNDPDMYEIPVNVPVDTVKLRIEKTVIRRIPTEAFYYLVDLKYLWLTYNCIANIDISSFYNLKLLHELRLDGNLLSTFPWESLAEMPNLRTLDLHNNKLTSIPADAGRYLRNLTYLDISSNKLTTLPSDLMDIWPPFLEAVLSKTTDILVTERVILVIQETPGEGVRWSIISLTGISYKDAGEYRCKAKNLAGMSEAAVTVTVVGVVTTTVSPQKYGRKQDTEKQNNTQEESKQEPERTTTPLPTTPTTTTLVSTERPTSTRFTDKKQSRPVFDGRKNSKAVTNGNKKQTGELSKKGEETKQAGEISKKSGETSLNTTDSAEQDVTVKDLRVISETDERVTLTWKTVNATSNSAVTVLYSKYGEKDMLPLSTDSSKNRVTIDGLHPSTQYMACVSPKGVPPTKEQCIIFSTDSLNDESSSQFSTLILASSAACVVFLPLIIFLIYKVLKLHLKPRTAKEAELARETYVKFETLSLKPRPMNAGDQLWARRYTDESERLLLCSRSSMDSQMTFKSEGSRSEYLC